MKSPPPEIDNAKVLWWASSGETYYGKIHGIRICGMAVCQYSSGTIYRFLCDRQWETIDDVECDDEEQAKTFYPSMYAKKAGPIVWNKVEG